MNLDLRAEIRIKRGFSFNVCICSLSERKLQEMLLAMAYSAFHYNSTATTACPKGHFPDCNSWSDGSPSRLPKVLSFSWAAWRNVQGDQQRSSQPWTFRSVKQKRTAFRTALQRNRWMGSSPIQLQLLCFNGQEMLLLNLLGYAHNTLNRSTWALLFKLCAKYFSSFDRSKCFFNQCWLKWSLKNNEKIKKGKM